ncbi:hypothetical protein C4K09_2008 [Pseudomonas chlororaphis subsp. aureofaciens]|nr:hypothetical protein C4K09_2008 [Pseudomonas chlororaphis subsp. aureofaciens]
MHIQISTPGGHVDTVIYKANFIDTLVSQYKIAFLEVGNGFHDTINQHTYPFSTLTLGWRAKNPHLALDISW